LGKVKVILPPMGRGVTTVNAAVTTTVVTLFGRWSAAAKPKACRPPMTPPICCVAGAELNARSVEV